MRAVTLIASSSEFLADLEQRKVRGALLAGGASLEELDVADPERTAMVLGTASLFADERVILLRGDVRAIEPHIPAVIAFAEQPLPGTKLLIVTTSAKTLAKKLGTHAETIEIEPPKPWETASWVVKQARATGKPIKPEAAELLVDALGTDLRELATALETLSLSSSSVITPDTVTQHFHGHETALYTLLDDVLNRDRANALRNLRSLLLAGDHPLVVHAALVKQFRSLAAIAGRAKHDQPSAAELDVSPGYLRRAGKAIRGWDADSIRRAIIALAEADLALKGGFEGEETPPEMIIELLLLELTASREELAATPGTR